MSRVSPRVARAHAARLCGSACACARAYECIFLARLCLAEIRDYLRSTLVDAWVQSQALPTSLLGNEVAKNAQGLYGLTGTFAVFSL